MNDKELADKIVALGVGTSGNNDWYLPPKYEFWQTSISARTFVRDWRVTGALMEICAGVTIIKERSIFIASVWATEDSNRMLADSANSMSRAINEACVEALCTT